MTFTPEVRERLRALVQAKRALKVRIIGAAGSAGVVVDELDACLQHIDALEARVAELELKVIAKTADATSLRARVAVLAAALNEAADAWPRPNKYDDILGALEGGSRG